MLLSSIFGRGDLLLAKLEYTNIYFLEFEDGASAGGVEKPATKAIDPDSPGTSSLGDVTTRIVATDIVESETIGNRLTVTVKWTAATKDSKEVYPSVEYKKMGYDVEAGEITSTYVEVISETSIGVTEACVAIFESNVTPGEFAYNNDAASTDKDNGINSYKNEIVYYLSSGKDYVLDIDELLEDYISYNLQGAVVLTRPEINNLGTTWDWDLTSSTVFNTAADWAGSAAPALSLAAASGTGAAWTDRGEYVYDYTAGKATLTFDAPEVSATATYSLVLMLDDEYDNYKDYTYVDVYGNEQDTKVGTSYPYADMDEIGRGFVFRYVQFVVNPVGGDTETYKTYVPYGAPGTDAAVFATAANKTSDGADNAKDVMANLVSTSTYEVSDVELTYTAAADTYGSYIGTSKANYQTYLEENIATIATAEIGESATLIATEVFNFGLTLTNTEAQPVLPGEYVLTATLTETDEDGVVTMSDYETTVKVYAPSYTVELASALVANSGDCYENGLPYKYNKDGELATGTDEVKGYAFDTYYWEDFDLVRLVDPAQVKRADASPAPTATVSYEVVPTAIVSTTYTDDNLAFYDPLSLRFSPSYSKVTTTPKATTTSWTALGLNVTFDGQDSANAQLIDIPAPAEAAGDVSTEVTFFIDLVNGLRLPVSIVKSATAYNMDGKITVNVLANSLEKDADDSYDNNVTAKITIPAAKATDPNDTHYDGGSATDAVSYQELVNGAKYYVEINTMNRMKAVYLNGLREDYTTAILTAASTKYIGGTPSYTDLISLTSSDYVAANSGITTTLSDEYIAWYNAYVGAKLAAPTDVILDVCWPDGAYDDNAATAAGLNYGSITDGSLMYKVDTEAVVAEAAGTVASQIGIGGLPYESTDLITSITYELVAGSLDNDGVSSTKPSLPTGLTEDSVLIAIDSETGLITSTTSQSTVSTADLYYSVKVSVTDAFGNVGTKTLPFPISFTKN